MAVDGGRVAARGFQYQYLRTVEALLASLNDAQVVACRIEGPADASSLQHADSVDFDLVDAAGKSLMAVQVKSAGAGRVVRAPEAVSVLVQLVSGFDASEYKLITSAAPDENCMYLAQVLQRHGDDVIALRAELEKLLKRAPAAWKLCEALSTDQWQSLSRASIEFDTRSDEQLRENLNDELRQQRAQAGRGLSQRSGGLVMGYLVAEVMRRAAAPELACWEISEFRRRVLVGDGELLAAVGRQDFGLVFGQMPWVPEVERAELVERISEVFARARSVSEEVAICAVTGLSGLGKSSLAAAYVAAQAFRYDVVFWVDAETEETLAASFARILMHLTGASESGEVIAPDLLRERVHVQLQSLAGPWLMVFDDAHPRDVAAWLPRRGRGSVIVTSLSRHWHRVECIEISPMHHGEALKLLRLRLGLSEQAATEREATLSKLAQTLEYWPLVIEVACGYIASCGIPSDRIDSYAETLIARAADDVDSVPSGYPRTLSAAVGLSIERLKHSARARNLLRPTLATLAALCWLGARRAPVHLAVATAFVDPSALLTAPAWIALDESVFPVREVIRELLSVSFVRYDEQLPSRSGTSSGIDDTVSMNSVLQQILSKLLLLAENATEGLPRVAGHTDRWLRGAIETGQAERAWELAQHATAVVHHIEAAGVADVCTSVLIGNLAGFHHASGRYQVAERLLELELNWLRHAGEPDMSLSAQAHRVLAHIAQVRQQSNASAEIVAHLRHVLAYLRQVDAPFEPAVLNLCVEASLLVKTQVQISRTEDLVELSAELDEVTAGLSETEESRAVKALVDIEGLLSSGDSELAEAGARDALSRSHPWTAASADLKRLLLEAYLMQRKWDEVDGGLDEFLPYAGTRTLYGLSVNRLVHNAGLFCAWEWIAKGDQRAVEFLGRLLEETGVLDVPAPKDSTEQAKFLLLRAVHAGWEAVRAGGEGTGFMEILSQLSDRAFTDPHDPESVWERIYYGLGMRMNSAMAEAEQNAFLEEGGEIIAANSGLLLQNSDVAAIYEAGDCRAVLSLSSDPVYGIFAGRSNLDLLLPGANRFLGGAKPIVILQPEAMLASSSAETGKTVEMQIHRACAKGFRRLLGPHPVVPWAEHLTVTLSGRSLILAHVDGTVVSRALVRPSGQWLAAARERRSAFVLFGFGFDLHDRTLHHKIMSSTAETGRRFRAASDSGLLVAALVSVKVEPHPSTPNASGLGSESVRIQPRRTTRSARRKGR